MHKLKTSKKRGFCIDDIPISKVKSKAKWTKVDPKTHFRNRKEVAIALLQCLENNDPESFVEILETYLQVNKSEMAHKTSLFRQTVKNAFSGNGIYGLLF